MSHSIMISALRVTQFVHGRAEYITNVSKAFQSGKIYAKDRVEALINL